MLERFNLTGRTAVITGGAGLLGVQHAQAVAELGGIPILWDTNAEELDKAVTKITKDYSVACHGALIDITDKHSIHSGINDILKLHPKIDILINNAARDPKVDSNTDLLNNRLENYPLETWMADINVGLTGALLCAQAIGPEMVKHKSGVILNISSDLGLIAPDQRLYADPNKAKHEQSVKPVSYSVIKHGLIGLTKYIATYWAEDGIRCNALAPAGVYTSQPPEFVEKFSKLLPMGRMAHVDEYKGAIQYLASDASSFMTGSVMTVDGGRTCW